MLFNVYSMLHFLLVNEINDFAEEEKLEVEIIEMRSDAASW